MNVKKSKANIKVLVKCNFNWADEMDIEGFALFSLREWEYICKEINAIEYPVEWYVGSNQEIPFECANDVFNGFDISILTSEETEIIERRFIKFGEYGETPFGALQGNTPDTFFEENGLLEDYIKKG